MNIHVHLYVHDILHMYNPNMNIISCNLLIFPFFSMGNNNGETLCTKSSGIFFLCVAEGGSLNLGPQAGLLQSSHTHPFTHSFTPMVDLASSIHLCYLFLDSVRGRREHRGNPRRHRENMLELRTLLLWSSTATHWAIVLPMTHHCMWRKKAFIILHCIWNASETIFPFDRCMFHPLVWRDSYSVHNIKVRHFNPKYVAQQKLNGL